MEKAGGKGLLKGIGKGVGGVFLKPTAGEFLLDKTGNVRANWDLLRPLGFGGLPAGRDAQESPQLALQKQNERYPNIANKTGY